MKYSEETIENQLVRFIMIKDYYGWISEINGKEYGDFVILESPGDLEDIFIMLKIQAQDTIIELLK